MRSQLILVGLIGLVGAVGVRDWAAADPLSSVTPSLMTRHRGETFSKRATNDTHVPPPPSRFLTNATQKFAVDGSKLPDINWDVGESYAGSLPISDRSNDTSQLFFWFFPSATPEFAQKKEIVIWFNGGPGCSSLLGFLQENGPISWSQGMPAPQRNPFSFHLMTNMVWVEQPLGTGFSRGNETIRNEDDIARHFLGFWKNFVTTFRMQGYKVYITGQSYAGMYGPYIAQHMLDADDKDLYDVGGLLVWNGLMFGLELQTAVPAFAFLDQHHALMPLDQPTMERFRRVDRDCGFDDFRRQFLTYPAAGPMPPTVPGLHVHANGSKVWDKAACGSLSRDILVQVMAKNPCANSHNIVDRCSSLRLHGAIPEVGKAWPDREDVKRAIHAPADVTWHACQPIFPRGAADDGSDPAAVAALPRVIEATRNVVVAHGVFDYLLTLNGVLLGIQNMTWGGARGFSKRPRAPFYVPAYGYSLEALMSWATAEYGDGDDDDAAPTPTSTQPPPYGMERPAGYGVLGTTHEERGLTLVVTQLAGHQGPEHAPAAALRMLEKLLGRVADLSATKAFSLPAMRNVSQPTTATTGELGEGTVVIPWWGRGCRTAQQQGGETGPRDERRHKGHCCRHRLCSRYRLQRSKWWWW